MPDTDWVQHRSQYRTQHIGQRLVITSRDMRNQPHQHHSHQDEAGGQFEKGTYLAHRSDQHVTHTRQAIRRQLQQKRLIAPITMFEQPGRENGDHETQQV